MSWRTFYGWRMERVRTQQRIFVTRLDASFVSGGAEVAAPGTWCEEQGKPSRGRRGFGGEPPSLSEIVAWPGMG